MLKPADLSALLTILLTIDFSASAGSPPKPEDLAKQIKDKAPSVYSAMLSLLATISAYLKTLPGGDAATGELAKLASQINNFPIMHSSSL